MSEAISTIHAAEEAVNRSGESYFLPLIHVRKAGVIARALGHDKPGVLEILDQALAMAKRQGASSFATMINEKKQVYAREHAGKFSV
jgi:hypothetical protein